MNFTTTPGQTQQVSGATQSNALSTVTQPLVNLPQTANQFPNFPSSVWNLTPQSNVVKFLRTLLGDAGVGQLRKRLNAARLSQTMQSSSFYDLDGFYGSLFGIKRTPSEQIAIDSTPIDPTSDTATQAQWRQLAQADVSYKNRLFKFGRAISYGPTPIGMQLVAEAILNQTCTVSESFVYANQLGQTYEFFTENYTYLQLQDFTYGELSGITNNTPNALIQNQFIITPQYPISLVDAYNLKIVLDTLKPANTIFVIELGGTTGNPITIPVINAWSDSNYWEIESTILLNGTPTPQQRPPFSSYGGEQWFYNHDVNGIVSYTANPLNVVIQQTDYQIIVWADGTSTAFSPNNALLPWWQAILGRYAQDGVMAINPLSGFSTATTSSTVSDLYFDGNLAGDVISDIAIDSTSNQSGSNLNFWATDNRLGTDLTYDLIAFELASPHVVNVVSFDVAHFPQTVRVQYYDDISFAWGDIGVQNIYDSVPAILNTSDQYLTDKVHPQHKGANHWYHISLKFVPVQTSKIRVVLQRINGSVPQTQIIYPYLSNGVLTQNLVNVPYSLAVKNFELGFSILSTGDIPISGTDPVIDVATDILANPVTYSLYEELPTGPIQSTPTQWRCAPQPVNNAIVNYVLDIRDGANNPQTVDTIYIDPTQIGVHLTLYYSNDLPNNTIENQSNDTPLDPPLSQFNGVVSVAQNGLIFPSTNGTLGTVVIENSAVQLDINEPWWVGLDFQVNYMPSTGNIPFVDLMGNVLYYNIDNQVFLVSISNNALVNPLFDVSRFDESFFDGSNFLVSAPVNLPLNSNVNLLFAYTSNGCYLSYQINNGPTVTNFVTTSTLANLQQFSNFITIGGIGDNNSITSVDTSGMYLHNLVIKNETFNISTIPIFQSDPKSFCYKGVYRSSETASNTKNAVLRFDPSFVSDENPTGMVGGPTSFFPNVNWTPIPGDFILSKGWISIEPIQAKYIKFEMTNLVAEPFGGFLPVQSTVNTFGQNLINASTVSPVLSNNLGALPAGQTTLLNLNLGESLYPNSRPSPIQPSNTSATLITSPTAVSIATDPSFAQQIAQSPQFAYSDYHQGQSAPRFTLPSVHNYQQTTLGSSNQVAFFCGFNEIVLSRTNIEAVTDTRIYKEHFFDNLNIATSNWIQQNGILMSFPASEVNLLPSVAQSRTYFSASDLAGIQFAVQQSEPKEIVFDDNFTNSALQSNTWLDSSTWHIVGDISPSDINYSNNSIIITRQTENVPPPTGSGVLKVDIKPIISPVLSILSPGSVLDASSGFGGLESQAFQLSKAGRAWVAVRIVPLSPITNPWYIQLTDVGSGRIIWQTEIEGLSPNQVTEFYAPYDIGSVPGQNVAGALAVSVVQMGSSNDMVQIDRLSVFDEGIVWEFSNDGGITFYQAINIRNNSNGVLDFPLPGNELVWRVTCFQENMNITSLQLRPIYLNTINSLVQPNISGPNLSPADTNADISVDPQFKTWPLPIPRWWFLAFSQSVTLFPSGVVTNQFNQFINMVVEDVVDTSFVDTITYSIGHGKIGLEVIPLIVDNANWTRGFFARTQSDNIDTAFIDIPVFSIVEQDQFPVIIGPVIQALTAGGIANFTPPPAPSPVIPPTNITGLASQFVVGATYNDNVVANGTIPITYSILAGNLPDGITLNPGNGNVTGIPTTVESYSFQISATNSAGTFGQTFSGNVIQEDLPDMIVTTVLQPTGATAGDSIIFAATVENQGTAPTPTTNLRTIVNFAVDGEQVAVADNYSSAINPGQSVTISADSGWIATSGTHLLEATVNPGGAYNELNLQNNTGDTSFTVASLSIHWDLVNVPSGVDGIAYSTQFIATNATNFALGTGNLPPGLNLTSDGILSGTPTTTGTYTFNIVATNASFTDTAGPFTLVIAAPADEQITWSNQPNNPGTVGVPYSTQFNGTNVTTYSIFSGTVPPGLTLSSSGLLSGTPTTAGTYQFAINGANAFSSVAVGPIIVVIGLPVTWVTATDPPNGALNTAYTTTFKANNAVNYVIASGQLPTGVTLNASTGVLSGTPITSTQYPFTIKASNGGASSATSTQFNLTITTPYNYGPGGTYSGWNLPNPDGYTDISWIFLPVQDAPASLTTSTPGQPFAGVLHYYAMQFYIQNATAALGGGYAGFQTNGDFKGTAEGKVINFSIWGSSDGNTTNPNTLVDLTNSESSGVQMMLRYNWTVGHQYQFTITTGPGGVTNAGTWWGLTVTDKTTSVATYVGEQIIPNSISGKVSTTLRGFTEMFGEDTHWWNSITGNVKYTNPNVFQNSAMACLGVSGNSGSVPAVTMNWDTTTGVTNTGSNGFKSTNSKVTEYVNASTLRVQHNLGFWTTTPPNTAVNGVLIF